MHFISIGFEYLTLNEKNNRRILTTMLLPCKAQSNHKDQNKMKDCPNNQNIQNPCYPHTTLQYATAKITNKHVALQNAPPYHEVHKKSANCKIPLHQFAIQKLSQSFRNNVMHTPSPRGFLVAGSCFLLGPSGSYRGGY